MDYSNSKMRHDLKPVNFEPLQVQNVLSDDLLKVLQAECDYFRRTNQGEWDLKTFNRLCLHNPITLKAIHHAVILPLAEKALGRKLMPSYCFLSMYKEDGRCPPHFDRPQCRYTVDLCVNQKRYWDFFANTENGAETKEFRLGVNDAAILSGTRHFHWREDMQAELMNFCDMAFFHFVDADFIGDLS